MSLGGYYRGLAAAKPQLEALTAQNSVLRECLREAIEILEDADSTVEKLAEFVQRAKQLIGE